MAILPNELITYEILTRLPLASLLRFKCVSKSYNTLISSPEFIDLHLRRSLSSNSDRLLVLLTRNCKQLNLLDVDSPDPASSVVNIPLPYALDMLSDKYVSFLSSFNGLLCVGLQKRSFPTRDEIVLINPCTRVHRSIPRSNCSPRDKICCWESFGLGFDDINNDYKLVRVTLNDARLKSFEGPPTSNREVTVYSVKENTWKLVEDVDDTTEWHLNREQNGVVLKNHLLHWMFISFTDSKCRIWCFDARSNKWATKIPFLTSLPLPRKTSVCEMNLGVLQGCLCLSARVNDSCDVIWMMKEYGVTESWV